MSLYKTLSRFELFFQLGVGLIAFTALFASPLQNSTRLFCGASLLLIVGLLDLKEITDDYQREMQARLTFMYFAMTDRAAKGENVDWNAVVEEHMRRELNTSQSAGNGKTAVLILAAKYLFWILGGAFVSQPSSLSAIKSALTFS